METLYCICKDKCFKNNKPNTLTCMTKKKSVLFIIGFKPHTHTHTVIHKHTHTLILK